MVSPHTEVPSARAVLFDVAGTLLWKPLLVPTIRRVLARHGAVVDEQTIAIRHKLLSEIIDFPDETSAAFYAHFNRQLLRSLGVLASVKLSNEVYEACKNLPWAPYNDVQAVSELDASLGIVSNWDNSLAAALEPLEVTFDVVVGSSAAKMRKPDPAIFLIAAERLDLSPDTIAYVGDSVRLDIEPALSVGMRPVLVDRLDIFPAYPGLRTTDLNPIAALLGVPRSRKPKE